VRRLCIAVVFNRDKNRKHPRLISVLIQNKIYHFDLYRESSLKTLKQIKADITKIRELIIKANDKGHEIVCQDFRDLVETLELPIDQRDYNVYDTHLPKQESNDCIKACLQCPPPPAGLGGGALAATVGGAWRRRRRRPLR
jgi:hypothetical protein